MIVNLLPKPDELIEQSIMFNESMRGFGYKCEVLIPKNVALPEVGYHPDIGYDDADKFIAYISIDPHPKPKLLQSLGWDIESEDTKPMICYVARYLQHPKRPRDLTLDKDEIREILPQRYTRLILDYSYETYGKEFVVTKVSSNQFNPVYYIMMIVPYRPRVPNNPEPNEEDNTKILNIQQTDENFRFLGKDRAEQVGIKY